MAGNLNKSFVTETLFQRVTFNLQYSRTNVTHIALPDLARMCKQHLLVSLACNRNKNVYFYFLLGRSLANLTTRFSVIGGAYISHSRYEHETVGRWL